MTPNAPVALVTGATGFVGSHLAHLLDGSGTRVRCLTRATSSSRWLPGSVERVAAGISDGETVRRALQGVSVVYHLAAATSAVDDAAYRRANIELTQALLDAIADAAPQARVLLCSTLAAGGPAADGRPLTEADPSRPIGPYGATKLAAEGLVARSGLDYVIVRPPTVYGPRDRDILAVFRFARYGVVPSFAPAGQLLSLIHVRDLAQGLHLAATRGGKGSLYYVADGPPHSWGVIVDAMGAALGRRLRFVRVPLSIGAVAARASCAVARITSSKPLLTPERVLNMAQLAWTCDDSKARRELGFQATVGMHEGMAETARWYRAQGWL